MKTTIMFIGLLLVFANAVTSGEINYLWGTISGTGGGLAFAPGEVVGRGTDFTTPPVVGQAVPQSGGTNVNRGGGRAQ